MLLLLLVAVVANYHRERCWLTVRITLLELVQERSVAVAPRERSALLLWRTAIARSVGVLTSYANGG